MRRALVALVILAQTTSPAQARRAAPSTSAMVDVDQLPGFTLPEEDLRARYSRGRLHLVVPAECTGRCGGQLRVSLRTIAGSPVAWRTLRVVPGAAGPLRAVLRLGLPTARVELLVLHYDHRVARQRLRGAIALSRILDGPRLRLLGQDTVVAGTTAVLRILVQQSDVGAPVAGAPAVVVFRAPGQVPVVQRGLTGPGGVIAARFPVGEGLAGRTVRLEVEVRTPVGTRRLTAAVKVGVRAKVWLTTDKPIYQPGQTIHLRALALRTLGRGALAHAPVLLEGRDGRGNLVFRRATRTDAFGIAHARLALAERVNQGRYRLTARLALPGGGAHTAARTVRVFTYRLPKVRVRVRFDGRWAQPGQRVTGEVYVWYVWQRPAPGSAVRVVATLGGKAPRTLAEVRGRADAYGALRFSIPIPGDVQPGVGIPLRLGVTVTEPGGATRQAAAQLPLVAAPIRVVAIPESGALAMGIPQTVYLMTTLPDGAPTAAAVSVEEQRPDGTSATHRLRTDAAGIGALTITPTGDRVALALAARDRQGRTGEASVELHTPLVDDAILVRPGRGIYRVGESLAVTVLSNQPTGHAYVDLVRDGQTLATHDVALAGGRGDLMILLGPEASGTLLLTAYRFGARGELVRDTRPVLVEDDRALRVSITADRKVYAPGQAAQVSFRVTDAEGRPVVAALGVWVVDSAVYVLSEAQPGLAEAFFRLERTLLDPGAVRSGLDVDHLFGQRPGAAGTVEVAAARARRLRAAEVLLAASSPGFSNSLDVDGLAQHRARVARAAARRARPRLRRIAWRTVWAVRQWYLRNPCEDGPPEADDLVTEKWLSQTLLHDPWGEPVEVSVERPGDDLRMKVVVTSTGPDEEEDTDDDVAVTIPFRITTCGMCREYRKQGIFCRDSAIYGYAEDALGCLVGHTVGDESGLGGLGIGGGGRGGGSLGVGRPRVFMSRASVSGASPGRGRRGGRFSRRYLGSVRAPGATPAPRVRRDFPEALAVVPALITDPQGRATLPLRLADSITTWRVTGLASSADGRLGSATAGLRVFTPFFADVALPPELTRGDRLTVPVALHNNGDRPVEVTVRLRPAAWYRVTDGQRSRRVRVAARGVTKVLVPIEALRAGPGRLALTARGDGVGDALERSVRVHPGGEAVRFSTSDGLAPALASVVTLPPDAIPGSGQLQVRVAPGAVAATVDGLDALLAEPHGCFEQTSSTAYPNVMLLGFLKAEPRTAPKVLARARRLVSLGYQRLVTFESRGGGFSLFGSGPADPGLTAYGLHEFLDMARVHPVDKALIARTRAFLASRQDGDGAWDPKPSYFLHHQPTDRDWVLSTAYVAWALLRAGGRGAVIKNALAFLDTRLDQLDDPYVIALVAALLLEQRRLHPKVPGLVARLARLDQGQGKTSRWAPTGPTLTGTRGVAARVETTALVAWVLLRARRRLDLAGRALAYLARAKAPRGGWGSTQANVLVLRALLEARRLGRTRDARGVVEVALDGRPVGALRLTAQNVGVLQTLDLGAQLRPGTRHQVTLRFRGQGVPLAQILGGYHRPLRGAPPAQLGTPLVLGVHLDRTRLGLTGAATLTATLSNGGKRTAASPMVELGRPAGFDPAPEDLDALVASGRIARYDLEARRIVLYLTKLAAGARQTFRIRLRPRFAGRLTVPASSAYEYYVADVRARTAAATLTVE